MSYLFPIKDSTLNQGSQGSLAREGVIIEWPLNRQFHDARDVILKSRNDVRGFPSDDDDDEMSKFTLKQR